MFDLSGSTDLLYYLQLDGYEEEFTFKQFHLFGYEKEALFKPFHWLPNGEIKIITLLFLMVLIQTTVANKIADQNGGAGYYDGLIALMLFMSAPFFINTNLHLVRQNIGFYLASLFLLMPAKRGWFLLITACCFHEVIIPIFVGALIVKNRYLLLVGTSVLYGGLALFFMNSIYASFTERFTIIAIHFCYLFLLVTFLKLTKKKSNDFDNLQTAK